MEQSRNITNINAYYKLILIKNKNPKLTINNNGYEYLSDEVKKLHKKEIIEITEILKLLIPDFVEFNNFKPRKNGSFAIRCQCRWSSWFTGVCYFDIKDLKL